MQVSDFTKPLTMAIDVVSPHPVVHQGHQAPARGLLQVPIRRGLALRPLLLQAGVEGLDAVARAADVAADNADVLATLDRAGLSAEAFVRLLRVVKDCLQDEFFGLTRERCRPGVSALAVESALRCTDLDEVVQWWLRFYRTVTSGLVLELEQRLDDVVLAVSVSEPELDPQGFLTDFWLLWLYRTLSWLGGRRLTVRGVERPGIAGCDLSAPLHLSDFVPGQRRVNMRHALVCPRAELQRAVVRTQAQWQDLQRRGAAGIVAWPERDPRWSMRVRSLLQARLISGQGCLSQADVAARLAVSPQTLRRNLLQEGMQYQGLRDALRCELACELLQGSRLPVVEVGARMGFSEARAFTRAFRAWTGQTPSQWRSGKRA